MSAAAPAENVRAEERRPILAVVDIVAGTRKLGAMRIRNISPRGLGGSTTVALHVNQRIRVDVPGIGFVPARVAWARGLSCGLELKHPLDLDRFEIGGGLGRPPSAGRTA